jgi:hypothetical protein
MNQIRFVLALAFSAQLLTCATALAQSAAVDPQARIDAQIAVAIAWAAEPAIVEAVRAHNAGLTEAEEEMTQERWALLPTLDPLVRGYANNKVGQFLRSKRSAIIAEAFVCDTVGRKVGFIGKSSRWSHAGQPKHEVPMTGKNWQGRVELDDSSGLRLLQISVPVLDGDKPIGSLTVGLSAAVLSE